MKSKSASLARKINATARESYSLKNLWDALQYRVSRPTEVSERNVAIKFGVPRSTLQITYKAFKQQPAESRPANYDAFIAWRRRPGRPTALNPVIEKLLAQRLEIMAQRGHPLTRRRFTVRLNIFLQESAPSFKNSLPFDALRGPGRKWWKGFIKRHSTLAEKMPNRLSFNRVLACNSVAVARHFQCAQAVLNGDVKIAPQLLFNADETQLGYEESGRARAIGLRGKRLSRISFSREEREQHVTGLFAVSARGPPPPPLFIFIGKRKPRNLLDQAPPGSTLAMTDTGWIDKQSFEGWFRLSFLPHVKKQRELLVEDARNRGVDPPSLRSVLFVDGHNTHYAEETLCMAEQHDVIICLFPAHCTHVLQPLDVGIFGPFKEELNHRILEYKERFGYRFCGKLTVPAMVSELFDAYFGEQRSTAAFAKCGLYPVDSSKVANSPFVRQIQADAPPLDLPSEPEDNDNDDEDEDEHDTEDELYDDQEELAAPPGPIATGPQNGGPSGPTLPGELNLPSLAAVQTPPLPQSLLSATPESRNDFQSSASRSTDRSPLPAAIGSYTRRVKISDLERELQAKQDEIDRLQRLLRASNDARGSVMALAEANVAAMFPMPPALTQLSKPTHIALDGVVNMEIMAEHERKVAAAKQAKLDAKAAEKQRKKELREQERLARAQQKLAEKEAKKAEREEEKQKKRELELHEREERQRAKAAKQIKKSQAAAANAAKRLKNDLSRTRLVPSQVSSARPQRQRKVPLRLRDAQPSTEPDDTQLSADEGRDALSASDLPIPGMGTDKAHAFGVFCEAYGCDDQSVERCSDCDRAFCYIHAEHVVHATL